jgi:hypothetical protein
MDLFDVLVSLGVLNNCTVPSVDIYIYIYILYILRKMVPKLILENVHGFWKEYKKNGLDWMSLVNVWNF